MSMESTGMLNSYRTINKSSTLFDHYIHQCMLPQETTCYDSFLRLGNFNDIIANSFKLKLFSVKQCESGFHLHIYLMQLGLLFIKILKSFKLNTKDFCRYFSNSQFIKFGNIRLNVSSKCELCVTELFYFIHSSKYHVI